MQLKLELKALQVAKRQTPSHVGLKRENEKLKGELDDAICILRRVRDEQYWMPDVKRVLRQYAVKPL